MCEFLFHTCHRNKKCSYGWTVTSIKYLHYISIIMFIRYKTQWLEFYIVKFFYMIKIELSEKW